MIRMTTNGYCIASYEDFTSPVHFLKAAKKKAKRMNPPIDAYIADATISPTGAVRLYPLGIRPDKPEECERVWVADFGEGGKHVAD